MKQRYLVEKRKNGYSRYANFRIHDKRTGKHRDYYSAEFIYGCIDYCESTAKYPGYVHDQVWRLSTNH